MNPLQNKTRGLRSQRQTYSMLVGVAVGALLTGLVLPFAVGERPGDADVAATGDVPASNIATGSVDDPAGSVPNTDPMGSQPADVPDASAPAAASAPGGSNEAVAGGGVTPAGGDGGGAAVAGSGPPGGSTLRATDIGVSGTTIKLGFLLLDVGGIGRVGVGVPGVDPEQQRRTFEAQMAEINAAGGIHGRKVVGVYEKFDVLSHDDMRRACLAMRDQKVFAIVAAGGYYGPSMLCVTQEGGTPLISQGGSGTPTEYIRRSKGLLFAMYPISDRLMANWAAELDRLGVLKGKRIGILTGELTNPNNTVVGGELVPALERFGQKPVHISTFSADANTAASQVPVEIQQMRSKNVDLIMITTGTLVATQFVQSADAQGYRPRYTLTDWVSMNTDASNQNMPPSYDGTIGITTYRTGEEKLGAKENPAERACREIYERQTKSKLGEKGSNEHGLTVTNCTTLDATLRGLDKAGPELTRASFSRGMQTLGEIPMTLWGGGSFGPNKFGAADFVRSIRWFADCRCLKPTDDFRRSRF